MSDKLSRLLQSVSRWVPNKNDDPDQRVINALAKALEATTPENPGCPWDVDRRDEEEEQGIWIPGEE